MTDIKKSIKKTDNLVENIRNEINKNLGDGSIFTTTTNKNSYISDIISTGSLILDDAIGNNGFQMGRIVEIFGPESSGKTTLCLHTIKEAQKKGYVTAFVDMEHAIDVSYAKLIGVDTDNMLIAQPNNGESAFEIIIKLIEMQVKVIVLDSVAALVPKAEIEGEVNDNQMGLQARLMSKGLRRLSPLVSSHKVLLILTNQLRSKIGVMYGNPETTCGGNALKFYASIRLDMRRIEVLKKDNEILGINIKVKVVKNKCSAPFKEAIITILYKEGFSIDREIIDLGLKFNLINKSGSWYSHNEVKIGQGIETVVDFFSKNNQIKEKLKEEIITLLNNKNNFLKEEISSNEKKDTNIEN